MVKTQKLFSLHGGFLNASSRRTNQFELTHCNETKKRTLDSQTIRVSKHYVQPRWDENKTSIRNQPADVAPGQDHFVVVESLFIIIMTSRLGVK